MRFSREKPIHQPITSTAALRAGERPGPPTRKWDPYMLGIEEEYG